MTSQRYPPLPTSVLQLQMSFTCSIVSFAINFMRYRSLCKLRDTSKRTLFSFNAYSVQIHDAATSVKCIIPLTCRLMISWITNAFCAQRQLSNLSLVEIRNALNALCATQISDNISLTTYYTSWAPKHHSNAENPGKFVMRKSWDKRTLFESLL